MPPQQPPQNTGQYDFFMNSSSPQHSGSGLNGMGNFGGKGNSSFIKRIAVVVSIGVVVLILTIIVASMIGGSDSNLPHLLTVAEDQNEILNVTNTGTQNAVNQTNKNFAWSANLSMTTDQAQLISFITSHGSKAPSSKTLGLRESPTINTELTNAVNSSNFDGTFTNIMQTELSTYKIDLQTAYTHATNVSEKQLLMNQFNHAVLLQQELNSPYQ